jgi:hypothetical protein
LIAASGRRSISGYSIFLLHGSGIIAIMHANLLEPRMSAAVYTATVLTSARAAAGMTSRARRPLYRHSAG